MSENSENEKGEGTAVQSPPPPARLKLDTPISGEENLKLLFDRKKPMFIPNMNLDKELVLCPHDNDRPFFTDSGKDWFGVDWTFVPMVGGQMVTPNTFIMDSPSQWREKLLFPDFDAMDFTPGADQAASRRTPGVMGFYLMQDGLFERLLSLATSSEVFSFLAEDEELADAYFARMADYKIALMEKVIREWAPFEAFINSDDWGTQISTFISPAMYERYIYPNMKRIVDFAHDNGKYIVLHSCGKVQSITGYFEQMNADMWEAQNMNDLVALRKRFGRNLPIQISMDASITASKDATNDEIRAYVRHYVDTYALDGGVACQYAPRDPEANEIIARELFEYSYQHYKNL